MKRYLIKILDFLGLKKMIKAKINKVEFEILLLGHNLFNKTVVKQNKDCRSIPIIIISFNQLFYLKQLIDFLKKHHYNNIVIIDNNSTYKPLLEYFDEIESTLTIHRLNQNYGHLVFWEVKELFEKYSKGYYVVTDADIVPIKECPDDFIMRFKRKLDCTHSINKVGFSLKINDIPSSNTNKKEILKWESQFWKNQNKIGDFIANIDTTFALYRPGFMENSNDFYKALRTNYPYQARHGGWYIDNNNLNLEQIHYYATCNESSSWRIDEEGNLKHNLYIK